MIQPPVEVDGTLTVLAPLASTTDVMGADPASTGEVVETVVGPYVLVPTDSPVTEPEIVTLDEIAMRLRLQIRCPVLVTRNGRVVTIVLTRRLALADKLAAVRAGECLCHY